MPEARLVKKKISTSERVNALPGDAAYLFVCLILHADRDGRYSGNPTIVKRQIIPLRPCSVKQVDKWLDLMVASKDPVTGEGLIERYEVNGVKYLWMPGFRGEQGKAREGKEYPDWYVKEAPSELPLPPNHPQIAQPKPAPVEPVKELEPDMKHAVDIFEKEIGRMMTPMNLETLKDMVSHYGIDTFEQAARESVNSVKTGKPNLNYIEKVCESIKNKGTNGRQDEPAHDGRQVDLG